MNSFPCELVIYVLGFVCNLKDIASCMQVCSLWGDIMHDLNAKFAKEFEAGGYMRVANLLLWNHSNLHEFLCICKDKRIGSATIRRNPECIYAARLLFARDVLAIISKCIYCAESMLIAELYKAWPFVDDGMSVNNKGYVCFRVCGNKIKAWLGANPYIYFNSNYGDVRTLGIGEEITLGKRFAFRRIVDRKVEFDAFCGATIEVMKKFRM